MLRAAPYLLATSILLCACISRSAATNDTPSSAPAGQERVAEDLSGVDAPATPGPAVSLGQMRMQAILEAGGVRLHRLSADPSIPWRVLTNPNPNE